MSLQEIYLSLSNGEKCQFFDFKELRSNNQKSLVIIGTYDFGSPEKTVCIVSQLINKLLDDLPKITNIYYKAHPLFPVTEELQSFLNSKGIIILTEKGIPLEIFLWNNPKIMVAGFCSSVHSMINASRINYIFGELFGFSKIILNKRKIKFYDFSLSQQLAGILLREYNQMEQIKNQINILDNKKNKNNELSFPLR